MKGNLRWLIQGSSRDHYDFPIFLYSTNFIRFKKTYSDSKMYRINPGIDPQRTEIIKISYFLNHLRYVYSNILSLICKLL